MHGSEESVDLHIMSLTIWFLCCCSAGGCVVFVSVFMTWILEAFPEVSAKTKTLDSEMRYEGGDTVDI
jgi:hypothetical protein